MPVDRELIEVDARHAAGTRQLGQERRAAVEHQAAHGQPSDRISGATAPPSEDRRRARTAADAAECSALSNDDGCRCRWPIRRSVVDQQRAGLDRRAARVAVGADEPQHSGTLLDEAAVRRRAERGGMQQRLRDGDVERLGVDPGAAGLHVRAVKPCKSVPLFAPARSTPPLKLMVADPAPRTIERAVSTPPSRLMVPTPEA